MQPIGVAGCGRMGAPMLSALLGSGFNARGLDIRPASDFGPLAPVMTDDAGLFSNSLKTLITVVRDVEQTEDVLFGAQNIAGRAKSLETIIISSTLSPRYVRELRARIPARVALIDAPMSGAQVAAEQRRLSFMLGGSQDDLSAHQPLFAAMGAHFHHMGEFGAGMQAKVLNNMLAASNTVMTRLVLDWADEAGLDEDKLLALIHTSSGQNWFASGLKEIEFARDGYGSENSIGILKKDVESALDATPESGDTRLPDLLTQMLRDLKPRD